MSDPRVICWFSCGVASAVATKLALKKYSATHEIVIARTVIPTEHPDNARFAADCMWWFGHPILNLRSDRYRDQFDVAEKRRFINSPKGALCSTELKKMVRHEFERPDDIQVFGYTTDKRDAQRAHRFREQNPDIVFETPLIEAGLTKADCHGLVQRAGIDIPMMYRLGFVNNNCIGCWKGGAGYWNRVRVHFPEAFERAAKVERQVGHTALRIGGKPVYLDELPPDAGRYEAEPNIECSFFCQQADESLHQEPSL